MTRRRPPGSRRPPIDNGSPACSTTCKQSSRTPAANATCTPCRSYKSYLRRQASPRNTLPPPPTNERSQSRHEQQKCRWLGNPKRDRIQRVGRRTEIENHPRDRIDRHKIGRGWRARPNVEAVQHAAIEVERTISA